MGSWEGEWAGADNKKRKTPQTMILCCGEALIDMLPRDIDGGTAYLPAVGGAVFNTAIALGRLGEETGFFSGLSSDLFGRQLAAALAQANVDHLLSVRSTRPTTLAFVALTNGQAEYTFYDENSAGRMITRDELPDVPPIDAAHFGAISLIGEPCGDAYEALAMRLKDDCVISLDPNIRPGFVTDEAAYRARLERLVAIADIIKVSDEDMAWLAPGRAFADSAAQWLAQSAKLVMLTRGGEGATAINRAGEISVPAVPTQIADTVGAGDAFNAGLLAGLRRAGLLGKDRLASSQPEVLRPALELAARVAAITVARPGADPPWAHEIE